MSMQTQRSIERWVEDLDALFQRIAGVAAANGWTAHEKGTDISEWDWELGQQFSYQAPVLELTRVNGGGQQNRVTFEPKYRFVLGSAGRVDVYSFPALREIVLLHTADTTNYQNLSWEEAEDRVRAAPWRAFTDSLLDLKVDAGNDQELVALLDNLVAANVA